MSGSKRRGDWQLLLIVVGIIAILSIGFFLLFDWADSKSPWFFRVLVVLLATTIGYRIGRAIGDDKTRPKWLPFGVALLGAAIGLYFGAVRPAIHDYKRDKAFESLMADGRTTADHLDAIARDMPDPNRKEPITRELRERNVQALEMGIAWMKRYSDDFDRFSPEQRDELREQFGRIVEVSKAARESLARLARDDAFLSLMLEGRKTVADLQAVARDTPEPSQKKPLTPAIHLRMELSLERGTAWMKRYQDQVDTFTDEQRSALHEQYQQVIENSRVVREKLARIATKPK